MNTTQVLKILMFFLRRWLGRAWLSYEPLAKFIERVIFLSPIGSLWSKVRRAPA